MEKIRKAQAGHVLMAFQDGIKTAAVTLAEKKAGTRSGEHHLETASTTFH